MEGDEFTNTHCDQNDGNEHITASAPEGQDYVDLGSESWGENMGDSVGNTGQEELPESYWESLMMEHDVDMVSWLLNSGVPTLIDGGQEGFFIRPGTLVKTRDGCIKDVIDWLVGDLGFGKREIRFKPSYMVIYSDSVISHMRRLWFLKCSPGSQVIVAPFPSAPDDFEDPDEKYEYDEEDEEDDDEEDDDEENDEDENDEEDVRVDYDVNYDDEVLEDVPELEVNDDIQF